MASGPHTYVICSVFNPERFQGNRLAIVAVRGNAISQQRKSMIAKEFGFSETVFIHDAPGPGQPRKLDIFIETGQEITFAGHPVIGTAHYVFTFCEKVKHSSNPAERDAQRQTTILLTKAGPIQVSYNPYRQVAACSIPHNLHVHRERITIDQILVVQPQIQTVSTIEKLREKTFPIVSIVKGMTFALVDLTDAPEVLGALKKGGAPGSEGMLDEAWTPTFFGCLYYKRKDDLVGNDGEPTIHALQTRMITQDMEDPGTGSASCALACYLALHAKLPSPPASDVQVQPATSSEDKVTTGVVQEATAKDEDALANKTESITLGDATAAAAAGTKSRPQVKENVERHIFALQQGVEMGRLCMIAVEVDVKTGDDGARTVSNITLSGRATFFSKGELIGA